MRITKKRNVHQCTCVVCRTNARSTTAKEHRAINRVVASLDEKSRRRFAGLLALQRGWGGVERASEITGLSRPTVRRGRDEVQRVERLAERGRLRQTGAGQPAVEKNIRSS